MVATGGGEKEKKPAEREPIEPPAPRLRRLLARIIGLFITHGNGDGAISFISLASASIFRQRRPGPKPKSASLTRGDAVPLGAGK